MIEEVNKRMVKDAGFEQEEKAGKKSGSSGLSLQNCLQKKARALSV